MISLVIQTLILVILALTLIRLLVRVALVMLPLCKKSDVLSNVEEHNPSTGENTEPPEVTIIIPAYNEEEVIERTLRIALGLNYENLKVVVVDDGSTDQTYEVVEKFLDDERLRVLKIGNSRRAGAINIALNEIASPIICCTDADSVLDTEAIRQAIAWFEKDPCIGAVSGKLMVGNPVNLVTAFQIVEYAELNFTRQAQGYYGGVNVVPGPVGFFRSSALNEVGRFQIDTYAEDTDLTLELLKAGYDVVYDGSCKVWTEAPQTLNDLARQRYRWGRGVLQVLRKQPTLMVKSNWFPNWDNWSLISGYVWPLVVSVSLLIFLFLSVFAANANAVCASAFLVLFSIETLANTFGLILSREKRVYVYLLVPIKILVFDVVREVWKIRASIDEAFGVSMTWDKLNRHGTLLDEV